MLVTEIKLESIILNLGIEMYEVQFSVMSYVGDESCCNEQNVGERVEFIFCLRSVKKSLIHTYRSLSILESLIREQSPEIQKNI